MTADATRTLDDLADDFATKVTTLTRGVLGEDSPRFHAVNTGQRIRVAPIDDSEVIRPIPISVNGELRLGLRVIYYCCWDGYSTFMATDAADFHLHFAGVAEPLIRFEYLRRSKEPPGAHIQVHAHRDEMAYLLRLADAGRPKRGLKQDKVPRLSEMHIPVGGHRMRPSLEDVFLFLHREFAIDVQPDWHKVIDEYQREYRLVQMMTAVRDAPESAAVVLRDLGYTVTPPAVGIPAQAEDSKLYWP
ncbi:hypothetical protein AB0M29_41720 [Streptomyces sp. NPDC051976]|uniref:hypothetical protein n=1 Tax=Streptomyces sp. NPDC051976 TaxID=3154947 RepID=UPI003416EE71